MGIYDFDSGINGEKIFFWCGFNRRKFGRGFCQNGGSLLENFVQIKIKREQNIEQGTFFGNFTPVFK